MQRRHAFDQIWRQESGRGENYKFGLIFDIAREDAHIASSARSGAPWAGVYEVSNAFKQAANDPAVSLRPGQRALFFRLARCEVLDAGPGGCVDPWLRHNRRGSNSSCTTLRMRESMRCVAKPFGKRDRVQVRCARAPPEADFHGHREFAGRAELLRFGPRICEIGRGRLPSIRWPARFRLAICHTETAAPAARSRDSAPPIGRSSGRPNLRTVREHTGPSVLAPERSARPRDRR